MKSQLQQIDEGLSRAVNRARRTFLVRQLNKLEITETKDGIPLDVAELDVLEEMYQSVREDKQND